MKNSPNSLKIHDNNENCHDSGFHGIESRLLRRIDDSDDTDSLGKQKSERPSYLFSLYFFSFIALNQIIEHTEVKNQEMRRTLTVGSMIDDSIDFSTGRNWEQYFQIDACLFLIISVIFFYIY